eukprot:CAMPEP_0115839370 /NCGR_PEP_ID=MMETSP0287-20121206/6218_1 /TAXON_ID=412157 /ORGANISM="Chrysochromulina rotalis, Strain UIO044" /LENGTH=197 /DNA_ID=CAMNT_0003292943 /DNA_START=17 /DNA_END=610 /DNA_ORIENTATION=-
MTSVAWVSALALGWMVPCSTIAPAAGHISCRQLTRCGAPRLESNEIPDDGSFTETKSLLAQFQLGLAQQRADDTDGALETYDIFISAAEEHGASPHTFSEVLVNRGIIFAHRQDNAEARASFERALENRPLGSAHVNLALLCLAEGAANAASQGQSGSMPVSAVQAATDHCRSALELNDDARSVATAERLLGDMARR